MEKSTAQLDRLQAFVRASERASCVAELKEVIEQSLPEFGVDCYLMTHHTDFGVPEPGLVQLGNYPRELVALDRERGNWRNDAILKACERRTTGFLWDDVASIIAERPEHRRRAEEIARFGLSDGFVVPNHLPGDHLGSTHFTVTNGKHFPREQIGVLQSFASFAFEAARRLSRELEGPEVFDAPLTDRQRECLILWAAGKSDTVIGQLLDLKPGTVNKYMESAKRRYCVATRQQLMVRALYSSQVTFQEFFRSLKLPAEPVASHSASASRRPALRSRAQASNGAAAQP